YFVTNTNNCGSVNSNTINVLVNATPTASTISASGATTFCAGSSVTLSGNVGGTWSNGSTTANITVNASGNYFVTNSNNCGTINSNTIAVTVNPLPTAASITANGPTTICTGATVTLSGNNNGGTWSNGASTSSIVVSTTGNYFVTNTNNCGSVNSNTINVVVSNGPVASVISTNDATTFCEGNSITLAGNVGGIWNNGSSSGTLNVTQSGDYFVTNSDACGSVTSNHIIVIVNPLPVPATIATNGPSSICNGNSVELVGNVDGTWSNGATTPSIVVNNAGSFYVTNTNNCGTVNSNTINIVVDSLPAVPTISAIGATTFCSGSTVVLTGNVNGVWSNGESSPAIAVGVSGTYFVTNTNGCGNSVSNQIVVSVLPAAVIPLITQNGFTLEASTGYNSYQWFNNNFPIPNETNATFIPTASGDYYVLVVDSNGCQAQSAVYNFVFVSLSESELNADLLFMPNPSSHLLTILSKNNSLLSGNLKIWSVNGDLILEHQLNNQNQIKIDVSQWANGMYIVDLISDINVIKTKFMKQ
ncbi:MAG TPA: T9SS type A sorting domain-containing protein, partial [Bacteroidia bacterium]|nr:T9SS type A sorting domain-containing protein [Bacteroidia bacterium]